MPDVKTQTPIAWAENMFAVVRKGSAESATPEITALGSAAAQPAAAFGAITGPTFTGKVQFSGTGHAGLRLNNLTEAQRDSLTPAVGDMIFNTTTGQHEIWTGSDWVTEGVTAASGDRYIAAIIAALGLEPGERLGAVAAGGDTFEVDPAPTLDAFLSSSGDFFEVIQYMDQVLTKAHSSTLTITMDGARVADGDGSDSDSLNTVVSDVDANMDIQFATPHAWVDGKPWSVRCVSSSAGAWDITVSTSGSVAVELAPGVVIPELGANVGDALTIMGVWVGTAKVVVERTVADAA